MVRTAKGPENVAKGHNSKNYCSDRLEIEGIVSPDRFELKTERLHN